MNANASRCVASQDGDALRGELNGELNKLLVTRRWRS